MNVVKPVRESQTLQTREAAAYLGIARGTLQRLTAAGRIRGIAIGTGPKSRRVYAVAELDRFLAGEKLA